MDDADRAQEFIDRGIVESISRVAKVAGRSAYFCMDCDERIPEKRRKAYPGVQRCLQCQEEVEERGI